MILLFQMLTSTAAESSLVDETIDSIKENCVFFSQLRNEVRSSAAREEGQWAPVLSKFF